MRPNHAGLFHVTARSIAEEHIFRDDRDYLAGIQHLAELSSEGFLVCYGLCLIPTDYHLLATFEEGMLKRSIHRLNRRYAVGFNRRHARRGRVFDSPYVSVEVVDDAHWQWIDTYIAENPPHRPWPWSSYDSEFSFVRPLRGSKLRNLVKSEPGSSTGQPGSAF